MKPLFKATLPTLVVLFFVTAAAAQSPYASLPFSRESNNQGTTDYVLRPNVEEIHKRLGGEDKPYRIVGVVARPATNAAVLLLVNAQKELQLDPQTARQVTITVDSTDIENLSYELAAKNVEATDFVGNRECSYPVQRPSANCGRQFSGYENGSGCSPTRQRQSCRYPLPDG